SPGVSRAWLSAGIRSATKSTASSSRYTARGAIASSRWASRPIVPPAIPDTSTAAMTTNSQITPPSPCASGTLVAAAVHHRGGRVGHQTCAEVAVVVVAPAHRRRVGEECTPRHVVAADLGDRRRRARVHGDRLQLAVLGG